MEVGLHKRNHNSSICRNSPVNTILWLGDVDTDRVNEEADRRLLHEDIQNGLACELKAVQNQGGLWQSTKKIQEGGKRD